MRGRTDRRPKLLITVCIQAKVQSARSVMKKGFRDQTEVGQNKKPFKILSSPKSL